MRILVVANDYKPRWGGIAELSYQVSSGLARQNHDVTVLTESGADFAGLRFENHRVSGCLKSAPTRGPSMMRRLQVVSQNRWNARTIRKKIGEQTPDHVLCTNLKAYHADVFPSASIPYSLFLHGEEIAALLDRGSGRKIQLSDCLRSSERLFFNSRYSRDLAIRQFPDLLDRSVVTGCGTAVKAATKPDRQLSRLEHGWTDEPILLTVCRQHRRKGIDLVIRALPAIRRQFPRCRYIVAGDGPHQEEFQRVASKLGIHDAVTFLGEVSESHKAKLYHAADLFVMPSRPGASGEVEGFGISFLEANASGLAVVGSDVGGIPDAVADGINGVLVPPENVSALADAVTELLSEPQRCLRMAREGQKRIQEEYNWPSICSLIETHLSESHDSDATRQKLGVN
ncbi:MAG: glycosyltransferase family 4 protein [Planctomycetota bacterium]